MGCKTVTATTATSPDMHDVRSTWVCFHRLPVLLMKSMKEKRVPGAWARSRKPIPRYRKYPNPK